MWNKGWRDRIWSEFDNHFDVIVIGGGITGAGIFREAAFAGYKVLLLEANDFASGTSSRSSKLVHGGLRYLKNFQFKTTLNSVSERQQLLKHGKGLINHLDILFASYQGDKVPAWQMGLGMAIYGIMAGKWQYERLSCKASKELISGLNPNNLIAGFPYFDAQTDDARLTLRVLQEGADQGGLALNYAKVDSLLRDKNGVAQGVRVIDQAPEHFGRDAEITADIVISATGAWADELRDSAQKKRIRPLRGSHLGFSVERLPLPCSISINHPRDGRPVFAFPWEGITLVGTTDVDAKPDKGKEIPKDPAISQNEAEYLLEFVNFAFPNLGLEAEDVVSTWAGIRPVINTGKADPSKESREHAIWYEDGLLTITGGKLTTFRVMAKDVMKVAKRHLRSKTKPKKHFPILDSSKLIPSEYAERIDELSLARILGRYGVYGEKIIHASGGNLSKVPGSITLWQEIEWAAENERVVHLDDLLLRRTRVGLLLPNGGKEYLDPIRTLTKDSLQWDDTRWDKEVINYNQLIKTSYSMPHH